MKVKNTINQSFDAIGKLFREGIFPPIQEFAVDIKKLYLKDKISALVIVMAVFFIVLSSFFISYKFFIEGSFGSLNQSSQISQFASLDSRLNLDKAIGGNITPSSDTPEEGRKRAVSNYLDVYNKFFEYLGDFFNDYIGVTQDPLGHSTVSGGSVDFNPIVNKNNKLTFESGSSIFYSAYRYASILLTVVVPILVLLVIIKGFKILISSNNSHEYASLYSSLGRLMTTIILITVGTPLLLTGSVITTNLLNTTILKLSSAICPSGTTGASKTDLKCFVLGVSNNLKTANGTPENVVIEGWDILGWAKTQSFTFVGFLQSIPVILVTLIMLFLLVVILIQFILRYLQLYFLFCIYPIVTVFWYNESTSKYYSEYWKQIITLLIQQPVFLLCFVIFGDLSLSLLNGSPIVAFKPENLLIFTIYLAFLATGPQALSARIFGDFSAFASGQNFSDKINFAKTGLQNRGKLIAGGVGATVSGAIGKATNTTTKAGKNTIWHTPSAVKNTSNNIANGISSAVKDPIGTVQNIPSNIGSASAKVVESTKSGIQNAKDSIMDKSEFAMTGKIKAPRTKNGYIKTEKINTKENEDNQKWTEYSTNRRRVQGNKSKSNVKYS
jgi:hypothetical protein